jgi:hypothetical protein
MALEQSLVRGLGLPQLFRALDVCKGTIRRKGWEEVLASTRGKMHRQTSASQSVPEDALHHLQDSIEAARDVVVRQIDHITIHSELKRSIYTRCCDQGGELTQDRNRKWYNKVMR